MKVKSKILSFTLSMLLTASLLSGCGKSNGTNTLDFSNATLSGTITAVEDNKITVSLSGGMGGGRMMGDKPDGTAKGQSTDNNNTETSGEEDKTSAESNDENLQAPADMPEAQDGQTPPEMPDGENAGNEAPDNAGKNDNANMGGSGFPQSNSTFILTITDESLLSECTMSDMQEGSFITITFGEDNTISSISVMKLTTTDETDTSSMQPNGEAPNGNNGGDSAVNTGTGATTITENAEKSDISYMSDSDDENALRVEGSVIYKGTSLTIKKSGSTSDTESSDFYGLNAGILALDGATATITDSTITTDGQGANGIFAYGSGSNVTISNTSITTTADNSGGIDVTGGASIEATNLTIETNGNSSAAIRSDRGGGTLNVSNGSYTTNGTGSPAVYCTADITVSDATLNATASEGVVIEGKNSVTLENCDITSNMQGTYQGDENENLHGIMIYQSMSGDAAEGEANFTMNGGSITAQNGDLIYSTNTSSVMNLNNVALTLANDTLLRISGNDGSRGWGETGNNGADMRLFATNQTLNGKIIVDEISSLTLNLSENSSLEGSINEAQEGGTVTVNLDADSTWKLTGDSYISTFEGSLDNVDFNGYTLYVNGEAQTK